MRRVRFLAFAAAIALLPACDSASPRLGIDTPMRVSRAQFFEGPLPEGEDGQRITYISTNNPTVYPGASGKTIDGRVDNEAVAIAVAFPELSDTHWVLPAGATAPESPDERTWSIEADFSREIPSGWQTLHFVGIDADGKPGPRRELDLCFLPRIPDNGHACDPSRALPELVIVVDFNVDADVDLEVLMPDGRWVTAKTPLVIAPEKNGETDPESPRLDRDSLSMCVADGWNQEALVFAERPEGNIGVYARLFESCGHPSVRYRARIFEPNDEGTELELKDEGHGVFLSKYDARGSSGTPVHILEWNAGD
ncbi:MAG: hypothetical protein GX614_10780 [Sandaracinaceae bacterium]|nr:hypothetical protein [Sandaracinaceae bacterium]